MKRMMTPRRLAFASMIAAMYITLVMLGVGWAFGPVQFRVAEALTLLPLLFPEAIPGLFIGCALSNLLSNYGPPDVIFGSLATLAAALLTARCKHKWKAALPPILINAMVVGLLITLFTPDVTASATAFAANAVSVGLGQAVACFGLGIPLVLALEKVNIRHKLRL